MGNDVKTRADDADVAAFISRSGDEDRQADCHTLVDLFSDITGEPPRMWGSSIIGFGSYHYVYESGKEGDWPLVGFSPRARNFSIYIMSGFEAFDALLERLGKHKTGKSCLYVNRVSDIDLDALREMAARSVAALRDRHG
ncbi:MAG: DUF1801 domain-containing protein [Xanthomonadales bacterium]|nr:DUF1801 domain-containing protein [Xanthomonadales bacterium]